jgi:hypothetical protein
MLIEGGYAFSIRLLLEKGSVEEMALASRQGHAGPCDKVKAGGLVAWIGRLWPVICLADPRPHSHSRVRSDEA